MVPASLIQIHYHDRSGGVRETIRAYHDAFRTIAGADAPNWVLCSGSGLFQDFQCQWINIPRADYHCFHTRNTYEMATTFLTMQLSDILESIDLRFPVAIIAHNLNLGKNIALSTAFRNCALQYGTNSERYRFFSVLHDFVEDGRSNLMRPLRKIKTAGIDIDGILYSSGAPVHFIVPNRKAAVVVGLDRRFLSVLPNRIPQDTSVGTPTTSVLLRERLSSLARTDGLTFNTEQRMFCYPSRIICRKNVYEAFLFTTVLLESALITGGPGTSVKDRRRIGTVQNIARKYGRSLLTDPSRLFPAVPATKNPFVALYPLIDAIITTSRSEGFGFSLFEPWLYGKPVIGRMPAGTSLLPSMRIPSLYDRLPVPVKWVNIDKCYRHVADSYSATFGKEYLSLRAYKKKCICQDTIDFGMLDELQQVALVIRLCRLDRDRDTLITLLSSRLCGWPGLERARYVNRQLVEYNADCVHRWNDNRFLKKFIRCIALLPVCPDSKRWYRKIAEFYGNSESFQPQ